jgi:asparagine synthase (glutamine-hydrolysing)
LPEYAQYQTVHAPNTIIKDVYVLPAGNYLKVTKQKEEIVCYWNPNKYAENKINTDSKETVTDNIAQLLRKSIQRRMIADVPYGAFLSGGIDSSIIVGLMSEIATKPVNTFSVTFDEREFTEAKYSNIVAQHFGTNHHEIQLKVEDFIKELPNALASMDHPSGDGPNSYIVSKVTQKAGVTMALSGLGGDELFAGYSIFKQAYDIRSKRYLNKIPLSARKIGGQVLNKIKGDVSGEKIAEILELHTVSPATIYPIYRKALLDKQVDSLFDFRATADINILTHQSNSRNDSTNVLSEVSIYEMATYMQNVLLRDTDQMSMASSLEVRVPFLDHELVEYVLAVSDNLKYPHTPKKLLTDAMKGLVPEEVINRPKMGFVFPWKEWLKGELKQFCDNNIKAIEKRGIYKKGAITQLWSAFLNDDPKVTWSRVWHIIVLEDWMQQNSIEL